MRTKRSLAPRWETTPARLQFSPPGPSTFALLKKGQNGFALALGGGLALRATKRISIRGSIDYNPVLLFR